MTNNNKPVAKSGSYPAIWFNIVVCGCLIVGGSVIGLTSNPFGLFVALIGIFIEVGFVRNLRAVNRERKEDPQDD